jgi:hypothetical protein
MMHKTWIHARIKELEKAKSFMLRFPEQQETPGFTLPSGEKIEQIDQDAATADSELKQLGDMLKKFLILEDELLRLQFGESFFAWIVYLGGKGNMRNEALRRFAEEGLGKKRETLKAWEMALDLYGGKPGSLNQ